MSVFSDQMKEIIEWSSNRDPLMAKLSDPMEKTLLAVLGTITLLYSKSNPRDVIKESQFVFDLESKVCFSKSTVFRSDTAHGFVLKEQLNTLGYWVEITLLLPGMSDEKIESNTTKPLRRHYHEKETLEIFTRMAEDLWPGRKRGPTDLIMEFVIKPACQHPHAPEKEQEFYVNSETDQALKIFFPL